MTAPNLNILFSDVYSIVNTVFFFLSKPLKAKATTTNKKETNKKNPTMFRFLSLNVVICSFYI